MPLVLKNSFQPSGKEIWNHVTWAIEALEAGEDFIRIIANKHNDEALEFLEVDNMNDVFRWVLVFLREIKDIGPRKCFVPHGWADRCTESGYTDLFLYPYVFQSQYFTRTIYLKFAIRKTEDSETPHLYCHLDLHESNYA